jgi:hypothetical protein
MRQPDGRKLSQAACGSRPCTKLLLRNKTLMYVDRFYTFNRNLLHRSRSTFHVHTTCSSALYTDWARDDDQHSWEPSSSATHFTDSFRFQFLASTSITCVTPNEFLDLVQEAAQRHIRNTGVALKHFMYSVTVQGKQRVTNTFVRTTPDHGRSVIR